MFLCLLFYFDWVHSFAWIGMRPRATHLSAVSEALALLGAHRERSSTEHYDTSQEALTKQDHCA